MRAEFHPPEPTGSAALRAERCSSKPGSIAARAEGSEAEVIDPIRRRVVGITDAVEHFLGRNRFQGTDPDDFVVKCAVGGPRSVFAGDDDPIRGLHGGHSRTLEAGNAWRSGAAMSLVPTARKTAERPRLVVDSAVAVQRDRDGSVKTTRPRRET
jgi:hypothetical protein